MYVMKTRTWSERELRDAVQIARSFKQVLEKLGLVVTTGNYRQLKKYISEFDLDVSHFQGRGWKRGKVGLPPSNKIPLCEILVQDSSYHTSRLSKRLEKESVLEYTCSECGLSSEWIGKKLVLHLDHINGNSRDHRIENLRYLCPNCHSQTSTYCRGSKFASRLQPTAVTP